MVRFGATGGGSKARTLCGARDYCLFARVVGMERLVGVKQSLRLDGRKVW